MTSPGGSEDRARAAISETGVTKYDINDRSYMMKSDTNQVPHRYCYQYDNGHNYHEVMLTPLLFHHNRGECNLAYGHGYGCCGRRVHLLAAAAHTLHDIRDRAFR